MFGTVVESEGRERDGPFLIVCEHASCRLPVQLSNLGLASEHLESHPAWDIGASGVASGLARRLGGPLVSGAISRRVCDLNRPPEAHDAIPGVARILDRHGAANSLPGVMIEIRNDMISEEEEREALAEELAGRVQAATASLNEGRAQW